MTREEIIDLYVETGDYNLVQQSLYILQSDGGRCGL